MIVCPSCQTKYEEVSSRFCGKCGSDMRRDGRRGEAELDVHVGRVIDGRYRVLDKIGQGGMGAVYQVEHLAMGKIAAMKMLHPALTSDVEVARRFRREAEAVSRLSHSNTVQVFDFGESDGCMYLVMELVRGEDLSAILRREGPLPFFRVCTIFMQLCDALAEAHEAGIVHRDLKPENLLVARTRDGGDLLKVVDFGLAKLRDVEEHNQVTARGSLLGTPYYMSPEQIRAEPLDGRSDLYSLGAVMYRVVTGEHPFTAPSPVGVVTQHLTEPLILPSRRRPDLLIRPELDAIIVRAMAKRKEDRHASADELKRALEQALRAISQPWPKGAAPSLTGGVTLEMSPPSSAGALKREDVDAYETALKTRRRLGLIAVPLLLLLGAAAVLVWHARPPVGVEEESEPNDSPAQANRIVSDRTVRGHLGKRISVEESDRDFYVFSAGRGAQVLRVDLTGIPTMDLKLEVFDAAGRRIAQTDAGGIGDGEIIPNLRLVGGDGFLAVREVWVGGRAASENVSDWYTVTASWHPLAPNEESEPDDAPPDAIPLTLAQPMRGYLGRLGDVDYFYPRGDGGGTLSGFLSGIEGVDTRIVILPPGTIAGAEHGGSSVTWPPSARIFDTGGPGAPEHFDGVAWPAGSVGPLIVVERKDRAADEEGNRRALVGIDVPYSLTVRQTR